MTTNVSNITNARGNKIANQFIISTPKEVIFQSYNSIIAKKNKATGKITLDRYYWDYSATTGKYRNIFIGETKKETEQKIASGEYKLSNLNR